ncbi:hypothetical protein F5876DRAFT_85048 [Lentinula aff. lateritia]|uniref:Uncharacterized protein n=1 Tax=Lentinula aff. lateritia TaxID=2804960 RepID=A0ACC1TFS3_9AGAR|nr:hypothetical protein F5876DRAFT_85048 [Lentinula aff. lateritia]
MPQQMGPLPPYFFPPHFHPNAPPSQSFYTHSPAPHGYYTHGAPPMFASSYQPVLSTPTSLSNSPNVTLSSFCQFYHISDVDKQRLEMLEYRPGNHAIESLEKEEWSGASFKPLSWSNIMAMHQKFLKDVKAGMWDHCKD